MRKEYEKIFTPMKIGKVQIRNRFAMSAMAMAQVDENWAYKSESADYFVERAKGGTGLIITGANFVDNKIEKHLLASFPCPTVNPAAYMRGLRKIADGIHAYDSKLFVQLTAGLGRSAIPDMIEGNTFVAPSETTNRWNPTIKHRALTTEEIYEIIKQFATSAFLAKMGGADGIEVHAVHEGYLLDNFTMEHFNHRTDEFGGDMMGRLRFPIAILKAVKQACGEDFPVILRFSLKSFIREERHGILPGEDFPELGRDIEEGLAFAKILEQVGYDGLNVDAGSYDSWYWAHPPFFFERGLYLSFAEKVKAVVKIPVLAAGRLGYPDLAASAVNEGKTDMVVLGRPLLADPDFVNKMRLTKEADIRPCLSCHDGCFGRGHQLRTQSCAVNPTCNREREAFFLPADVKKQVVVIGAGPAGMEAARVLALRGHQVELLEKSDKPGGLYYYASIPAFKDDGKLLLKWYERQLQELGVKITYQHEVTEEDPKLYSADIVIHATGGTTLIPRLSGIERCVTALDILGGTVEAADEAVIIGGGLVGCELAIWLSQHGKKITIVEMADKLMAVGAPPDMNKQMIEELLEHHQVVPVLSSKLVEVKEGCIVVEDKEGTKEISAQQVILALGYLANNTLYNKIANKVTEIYNIGDSKGPKNIMEGIWDAYNLCSHL
ncbi:MAG: FAD-dependent oxidoreductase [Lachnospiraceae bacterium]